MSSSPVHIYCMANQDRSDRVRWLLEELETPYVDHYLSKKKGELQSADYLKLNPMGRVPTIVDGATVLFESIGICLYLADKYNKNGMAPAFDSEERGEYLQWMVFSVGSLECVVARMFTFGGKTEQQIAEIKAEVKAQCEILKKPLNQALSQRPYLLKSGFSAADIMMAAVIPGAWEYLVDPGSPLESYMQRLMSRPAAIKTRVFEAPEIH